MEDVRGLTVVGYLCFEHELNELNTGQHEGTAIADVLGETAHEKHSCHR